MKPSLHVSHWALIAVTFLWASVASAEPQKAWNAREVNAIAAELPAAVDALRDEMRATPEPPVGSGNRRDYYRFEQHLRLIRTDARRLARTLASGEDHDQTLPTVEHLLMLVRSARDVGRGMFWTEPMEEKVAAARAILDRLTPYYDVEALPPPIVP